MVSDVGIHTGVVIPVVPTPTDPTILSKDTSYEGETTLLENIQEEDDIPELIVDDSEGSIYELLQSQHGELDKEEVKSQNQDKTSSVVDDSQLDKLEEEDKKPWKL